MTQPMPRPATLRTAPILASLLVGAILLAACSTPDDGEPGRDDPPGSTSETVESVPNAVRAGNPAGEAMLDPDGPRLAYPTAGLTDTLPGSAWTVADWEIFRDAVTTATDAEVAELPLGDAVGRVGSLFVGWPYTPQTLEAPWIEAAAAGAPMDGSLERLVINLREFDCVSFVENALALTWFVRTHGTGLLDDPETARSTYEDLIVSLRYRDATVDGYASRLHYFTEWLGDNARRGSLELIHPDLDPALDDEPIDFMTTHVEAYPALADDPETVERIRRMEARLNADLPRPWVPGDRISGVSDRIRTGDVIAATSTVEGLDVAHTGIAIRLDGEIHLMHAPLVGSEVQISPVPLADRIARIEGQDGILVARPLER